MTDESVRRTAKFVVEAAVWAPSVHNTQPWWFRAGDNGLSLYADLGRQLMVADPAGREMLMSCGAALFTARLALRELGLVPTTAATHEAGDPSLVARLTWAAEAPPAAFERRLFRQVRTRRTHRGGFDPGPLAPDFLAVLQAGAERDGASLTVADDRNRALLAGAVQTAQQTLRLSTDYVQELSAWVAPPLSIRPDGVPATSYPNRPEHTDPDFPGRDFAYGHHWGMQSLCSPAAYHSPGVVCLLTTAQDRRADWISAGQALQRLLLTSAAAGVGAAMHSQPVEVDDVRELLRSQLCGGAYPQLVLRLGTVIQTAASVRRPAADVLQFASAPAGPEAEGAPAADGTPVPAQ